jgi:RecD/TraA family predicted helicase
MLGQWFGGSLPVGWVHSCPNNTLRTVMTGTFRRNWDSSMRTGVYGMVSPDPKGHGRGNSLHGKAAQNEEAFYGIEEASTSALQQGNVIVEGTIQKVQYRSSESGYSVLKVGISPEFVTAVPALALEGSPASSYKYKKRRKKGLSITVVGILPVLHVGQGVAVQGSWTTHPTYGMQLKAQQVDSRTPTGHDDLISFLSSGAIHGVGPSTATKLVETWGSEVLEVLDSADAVFHIQQCQGIGHAKAIAIKSAWDSGRDARLGATFLSEGGIPAGPAQRIAEAFGADTQHKVVADPYATLSRFGISLDTIEAFAIRTGATRDFASRVGLVIHACLMSASNRNGHAFVYWEDLESLVTKRLQALSNKFGGNFGDVSRDQLKHVAWYMCQRGTLICESQRVGDTGPQVALSRVPTVSVDTLRDIFSCITKKQFESLISTHGDGLVSALCSEDDNVMDQLLTCPGIGPKTAEKIMKIWKESRSDLAGKSSLYAISEIHDIGHANIEPPCEWSGRVRCYLPQFHKAETTVTSCVGQKARAKEYLSEDRKEKIKQWIDMNQRTTNVVLSRGQRAAIEMASDAPILVITGGPGCGKTTVLQYIVKLWCAQGKLVHICAPTGRAAQRIGAIQNVEPSTIHRLLKYRPKSSSEQNQGAIDSLDEDEIDFGEMDSFEHGESNKLESDAVLVDEASMLSLPLAAALMQSLNTKTQLILVGDVDQLPPVGPGGILDAMISSGVVPVVDLREIFRQEMTSSIVTSALSVRSGMYPPVQEVPTTDEHVKQAANCTGAIIMRASGDEIIEPIEKLVHAFVTEKMADIGDIQVICPMRKGPMGVGFLNPRIQAIVNPPELGKLEVSRGDLVLRMGDRVLQLFNDYDKDVYNGDQGTIVDVDPVLNKVWVKFSKGFGDQNQLIEYSGMELSNLDLSYAVTVHKAQGGEAKNVIMAMSQQHGKLLTRPLLYTGITRAKETLVLVAGSTFIDPISKSINTVGMETRLSSLVERLVSRATTEKLPFFEPVSYYDEDTDQKPLQNDNENAGSLETLLKSLQLDEGIAEMLINMEELKSGTCVDHATVTSHVDMIIERCTHGQASKNDVLKHVPYLLIASQGYLEKSIFFSEKIETRDSTSSDSIGSLVEQLANLRHSYTNE